MDAFIEAEEAAGHSVKRCCELFEVSRAAFYQRRKHEPSARDLAAVAGALNSRPRKTLDWRTPAEALDERLRSAQQGGVATTS